MEPIPRGIDLGGVTIEPVPEGRFHLDGGSMFGVIPRVFWERSDPPDPRGRILLGMTPLLVRTRGRVILIESGIGDRWAAKERDIYDVPPSGLVAGLAERGVAPADVDLLVQTHLHFDHVGAAVRADGGRLVPTFPRARVSVQRGEWEDAHRPSVRNRASYRRDDFIPLADRLDLVDGEAEVFPGIKVISTGGHTRFHQSVLVEGSREKAIFWGDLVPTSSHVNVPAVMGYDLFPAATSAAKEHWLPRAVEERWISIWYHDARRPVGRIVLSSGRFAAAPLA